MMIANMLGILRILLSFPIVYLISQEFTILSMILFALTIFTDFLDGFIARMRNEVTEFGKILDPLADKILYSSILLCFIELGYVTSILPILIILREMFVTGLRGVLLSMNKDTSSKLHGKIKSVLQDASVFIIILLKQSLFSEIILFLVFLFGMYSCFKYILEIYKIFKEEK